MGARDILDSIYELCKLVQKKECLKSKKLCLYYQIDKCLGPCELDISDERYKQELDLAKNLIENKRILLDKLQERMLFYAEELRFEEAGEIRDRCERIERSEHGCMGGGAAGRLANGPLKPGPFPCHLVYVGRRGTPVSVTGEMIGSERVDRDDDYVHPLVFTQPIGQLRDSEADHGETSQSEDAPTHSGKQP